MAGLGFITGLAHGFEHYTNHPKTRCSRLLRKFSTGVRACQCLLLTSMGNDSIKATNFFSLSGLTTPAICAGTVATLACATTLGYYKEKFLDRYGVNKKPAAEAMSQLTILGTGVLTGLAIGHGINKLL